MLVRPPCGTGEAAWSEVGQSWWGRRNGPRRRLPVDASDIGADLKDVLIPADRLQGSGLKQRPPVEIIFRDSRNQLWWRKGDGAMEQLTPEQGKNYFR